MITPKGSELNWIWSITLQSSFICQKNIDTWNDARSWQSTNITQVKLFLFTNAIINLSQLNMNRVWHNIFLVCFVDQTYYFWRLNQNHSHKTLIIQSTTIWKEEEFHPHIFTTIRTILIQQVITSHQVEDTKDQSFKANLSPSQE